MARPTLSIITLAWLCLFGLPSAHAIVWMAFNGIGYSQTSHATYWDNDNAGPLKNFATGETLDVAVTLSENNIVTYISNSLDLAYAEGTDAHQRFMDNSWINPQFVQSYDDSSVPLTQTLTFSNLNPAWTYEFYATSNRGNPSYVGDASRKTRFTISGTANTPLDDHSTGVEIDGLSGTINSGYNSLDGHVVGWQNIVPAPDGTFTITVSGVYNAVQDDYKSYSFQMFQLNAIPEGKHGALLLGLFTALLAGFAAAKQRRKTGSY